MSDKTEDARIVAVLNAWYRAEAEQGPPSLFPFRDTEGLESWSPQSIYRAKAVLKELEPFVQAARTAQQMETARHILGLILSALKQEDSLDTLRARLSEVLGVEIPE